MSRPEWWPARWPAHLELVDGRRRSVPAEQGTLFVVMLRNGVGVEVTRRGGPPATVALTDAGRLQLVDILQRPGTHETSVETIAGVLGVLVTPTGAVIRTDEPDHSVSVCLTTAGRVELVAALARIEDQ